MTNRRWKRDEYSAPVPTSARERDEMHLAVLATAAKHGITYACACGLTRGKWTHAPLTERVKRFSPSIGAEVFVDVDAGPSGRFLDMAPCSCGRPSKICPACQELAGLVACSTCNTRENPRAR